MDGFPGILKAAILVVDDQEANVFLLVRMLRTVDYSSIASATDATTVRDLHRKNRYDLILPDIQNHGF
jgi:diguanylate cyclase